jgi:ABC-type transport system substrate-binding protein
VKPAPDLPRRLALSRYCVVPVSTPVGPRGLEAPIPSAGPYYLAEHTAVSAVLKRNPNYHGPRRHRLDAIVYEFSVPPGEAAARIAKGTLDYVSEYDPALAPGSAAARAAGPRYRLLPDGIGSVRGLAFNTRRPLFAGIRLRRAVAYAIDRRALAATDGADGAIPATRLLSPMLPGFQRKPMYPLRPDLRTARRLAGSRRRRAVFMTFDPAADPYDAAFAGAVRRALAAIGISTTVLPVAVGEPRAALADKVARSDILAWGSTSDNADPVAYLRNLLLPPKDRAELDRIAKVLSPRREAKAAALAAKIERQTLFVVYAYGAIPTLVSRRLGCIVHQPEYAGIDLAALCLKQS